MTSTTYSPTARPTVSAPSHTWATIGAVAGALGIASVQLSSAIDAVYTVKSGNPDEIVAELADDTPVIVAFHITTVITALLLIVFAAGLKRRLEAQAPVGSLLPAVASGGLVLTAVAALMGSGLNTEFLFGVNAPEEGLVPEAAVVYGHWVGTIPWLWVGAGLAGVAVAVAALKHSAAPRWIGWVGAVLGGLTMLLGISPLQYMAGFTGPVWLLVTALGFLFADRRQV